MTGFGSATARLGSGAQQGSVTVEVKSVNQRFLDLKLSLPKEYASSEGELRGVVQAAVARGRIEVYVSRTAARDALKVEIDEDLARAYVAEWQRLQRKLKIPGEVDLSFLRGLTEIYRPREPKAATPENELAVVRKALEGALKQLDKARDREGKNLESDMRGRIRTLDGLATGMADRVKASLEDTRKRIEERIRELVGGEADEMRIVQEAAFLAERSDVTEELVRLKSHLAGLLELCGKAEPVGKRIEFLLQEVHREVNTVASKSSDLALTRLAVEAKGEVEKLREQVQNVE
jgi:uncharacterized protein (TIGR00255 family)